MMQPQSFPLKVMDTRMALLGTCASSEYVRSKYLQTLSSHHSFIELGPRIIKEAKRKDTEREKGLEEELSDAS